MDRLKKICYWTPRVLCIVEILLLSMFALDVFGPGQSLWRQVAGFIIHLIPSFILAIMLIIAWKWQSVGGIILIIAGLAFSIFLFRTGGRHNQSFLNYFTTFMALSFPMILSGALFIVSDYLNRKGNGSEPDSKME